jgi:hypothetical protein
VQWIWKQNKGHSGRESIAAYGLFVAYLELGIARSQNSMAARFGCSKQNISDKARRYNWQERAEAYDKWLAAGQPPDTSPPDEPQVEKKTRPEPKPKPPQGIRRPRSARQSPLIPPRKVYYDEASLEPEVVGSAMASADRQTGQLVEYRQVMHSVGRSMGLRAVAIDGMVGTMQGNIERSMQSHKEAMAAKDWAMANAQMQTVTTMVASFTKLCDAMRTQAEAARACWGDALGVNQMLKQMYQQMQAAKMDSD